MPFTLGQSADTFGRRKPLCTRRTYLGVSHVAVNADVGPIGTVGTMSYSSDLTDEQWDLLDRVLNAPGKRGPKHAR